METENENEQPVATEHSSGASNSAAVKAPPAEQVLLRRDLAANVRRFWHHPSVEESLAPYQVTSLRAHARMLAAGDLISDDALGSLLAALDEIETSLLRGEHFMGASDLDMYAALERRLNELSGSASLLRIGKTRNSQMACDTRLWLRDACLLDFRLLANVQRVILILAREHAEVVMPSHTHMQQAGPQLLSQWWLASACRFERDLERLKSVYRDTNLSPFAALGPAGNTGQLDRQLLASLLAFDGVIESTLDAVTDRDFLIEYLEFAALFAVHVSQLASELLIWTTQEFGFARLPRDFSFRSQSYPQKRNPEVLELLRCRSAMFSTRLSQTLSELKGIPVSYGHDIEESLQSVLDVEEDLKFVLELLQELLPRISFDVDRMARRASVDQVAAGNVVDYMVERGISPDKAQKAVEKLLEYCRQRDKHLSDLAPTEWQIFSPVFDTEIYSYVAQEESPDARSLASEYANQTVEAELKRLEESLADAEQWLADNSEKLKSCR